MLERRHPHFLPTPSFTLMQLSLCVVAAGSQPSEMLSCWLFLYISEKTSLCFTRPTRSRMSRMWHTSEEMIVATQFWWRASLFALLRQPAMAFWHCSWPTTSSAPTSCSGCLSKLCWWEWPVLTVRPLPNYGRSWTKLMLESSHLTHFFHHSLHVSMKTVSRNVGDMSFNHSITGVAVWQMLFNFY